MGRRDCRRKKINDGLVVEKLEDERVLPISKDEANNLSIQELDEILLFMGEDVLNLGTMPKEMKIEIVTNGGKVAKSDSEQMTVLEYDNNGNKLSEKSTDLMQADNDGRFSTMANDRISGDCYYNSYTCFSGRLSTYLLGKSGSNYKYSVYYRYDWHEFITTPENDVIGLAWSNQASKVAGSNYGNHAYYYGIDVRNVAMSIKETDINGFAYTVPMAIYNSKTMSGYAKVELYFSDRYKGDKQLIMGNYGHNKISPYINRVIIGTSFIDISGVNKEFIVEKNITVGN